MRSLEEIDVAVADAVQSVVLAFQASPFGFLYESDLHALLFSELRARLPHTFSVPRSNASEPPYELRLVYSEYRRIDLVCLDPFRAQAVLQEHHKGWDTYIYALPIHIGIELKYRKMGDIFDFAACRADLEKLKGLRASGGVTHTLALAFLQDTRYTEDFLSLAGLSWRESTIDHVSNLNAIYVFTPKDMFRYEEA